MTITLPPELDLHADASASLLTSLFASGTRLALDPHPGAGPLPPGQPIRGTTASDLFARGALLADRANSVLIGVPRSPTSTPPMSWWPPLKAMQRTLNTLSQRLPATTDEADATLRSMRRLAERLDSTIAVLPVGNAIERADTLARNLLGPVHPAHRHRRPARHPAAEGQQRRGDHRQVRGRYRRLYSGAAPPCSRSRP